MTTLGICIPTYRRPEFLDRCIRSAIASADGAPLRIFVADDSTNGANDAVLAALCAAHPFVSVHRNPVNLGIDGNIQRSVDLCDCDYAWLVGEDDTFLPGAVARMHALLQDAGEAFLFANYAYVGEDPSRPIGSALPVDGPERVDAARFIADHLWAVGFIGACVVRCADWRRTAAAPYAGTYYTHAGRIAELVADAGQVRVVRACGVANRVEGQDTFTWKRDTYGVFFGFLAMCRAAAARRPAFAAALQAAGATMERRYRWLSLRLAMRLRSEHGYDHAQYRKYLRGTPMGTARRLAFLAISLSPPAMFRPLVKAYRALRRPA